MGGQISWAMMSKMKPYLLMVGLQFGAAGNFIIGMAALNDGMNRYVLIVYRNVIAALVLLPFALFFERKKWPKMTLPIFLDIIALGFLEPVLDQGFTCWGMIYTSASFASAIINAVPSVTFVIALIFRLEHVKINEVRSQAKVFGILVTFGGALLMALYKGPVIDLVWSRTTSNHGKISHSSDKHWAIGTLFILLGCFAWSVFYVLQTITVKKYPAELTLSTLICISGSIQSAVVALIVERRPSAWSVGWNSRLLAPVYTGIVSSGITYYVQGLVLKTRGPVFVTAFNPLCMIIVSALGTIILREKFYLGSIIGGVIIAVGLYSVVWGKGKDYSSSAPLIHSKVEEAQQLPITALSDTKLLAAQNINGAQKDEK